MLQERFRLPHRPQERKTRLREPSAVRPCPELRSNQSFVRPGATSGEAILRWARRLVARSLSLPLGGLIAYRYLVGTGRLRHQLRFGALLLTRA